MSHTKFCSENLGSNSSRRVCLFGFETECLISVSPEVPVDVKENFDTTIPQDVCNIRRADSSCYLHLHVICWV